MLLKNDERGFYFTLKALFMLKIFKFLSWSFQNVIEELFSDPFLKNKKVAYLWINSLKFDSFFIVCQGDIYLKILKLSCKPLPSTSYKAFLKNKKRSGTSLPASFSAWLLKNNIIIIIIIIIWPNFIAFTSWDIGQYGNMCAVIVC